MNNDFLKPGGSDNNKPGTNENIRQFDKIPLPSGGKLYPGGEPSHLDVYYLTAKEEDILTSPNLIQSGKLYDELLKSVIKDKSIDPKNLLACDRNSILIWLRSTGYGSEYEVSTTCPKCGHEYIQTYMLDQLEDKVLEEEPDQNGLFDFETPVSKRKIKFKFLTGKDEQKLYNSKNNVTDRYQLMIKSVDGNESSFYIRDFATTMCVKDSMAFRKRVLSIEPGTILEQEATCPSCDFTRKEGIPLGINFFYPEYGV